MREEDVAYYTIRAQQERERAISCADNTIALAHLRMADEYDRLLAGKPRDSFLMQSGGDAAGEAVRQQPANQHG